MAVDDRVATFATAGPAGFKLVIWHSPDEHFTMDLAAANTPISAMCLVKGGSFVLFAEAGDTRIRLVELNEESICRGYRGIEVFDVARCPAAVKSLSISPGRMICAVDVNGDAWGFITGPESAAGPFGSGAAPLPLGPAPVASTSAAPSSALALSSAPVASSSSASGALASASLVPIAARALGPPPPRHLRRPLRRPPPPRPRPAPPPPRPRPRPALAPPPPLRRPHRLAGGIQHPARGRLCRCGLGLAASPGGLGEPPVPAAGIDVAAPAAASSPAAPAGAAVATTAELLQKLLESEKLKAEVEELKQKLLAMEEAKGIAEASAANKERELAEARAREAAAAAGEHQELGALRAKLATADGDIARAAAEQLVMAATLQAELDDVQARAAEFERKLDASKSSMQTLEQERESALTLAADVQAQARTLQQELEAASARHAEEKGALEKMLADCKTARRVAVGILDFAAADYERKKEEHSATKELLDSYTHKLTALKQDIVHFMQLDPDLARKSGADVIAALRAWKQSIQHFGRDGIVAASAAGAASLSGPGAEASSSSRPSSSLGRLSMDGSVILGSPAKSEGFLCAGLSASISGSDVLLASPAGILSHRSPPRAGASEGRYGPECGPATPSPSSLSLSFSAPGAPPAPILSHSPHCLPPAEDAEQDKKEGADPFNPQHGELADVPKRWRPNRGRRQERLAALAAKGKESERSEALPDDEAGDEEEQEQLDASQGSVAAVEVSGAEIQQQQQLGGSEAAKDAAEAAAALGRESARKRKAPEPEGENAGGSAASTPARRPAPSPSKGAGGAATPARAALALLRSPVNEFR
eukprot:tig00000430_g659.t1